MIITPPLRAPREARHHPAGRAQRGHDGRRITWCLNAVLLAALVGCGSGGSEPSGRARPAATSACTSAPALYADAVYPALQETCTTCHTPGGIASGSALVFAAGNELMANYNILRDFALASPATLLSKSIGEPNHGGGKPYVDAGSQRYKDLEQLIPQMTAQSCASVAAASPTDGGFWKGVSYGSNAALLAKATVLFAGRNPNAAELAAVNQGGETALRETMRAAMQGAGFDRFLEEVGDTHFLSPGALVRGTGGYNATDWPSAGAVLGANGVTQVDNATRNRFDASARREGIELMKFIVRNERPYSDMVAGNYTVMNGILARFLNATVQGTFTNADDDTEWRQATLPDQRLGGTREHAGILSTQPWLSRFPTTDTNRNRHRVNMLYRQFLATDATALAVRPLETTTTFKVPTVENPACAACHNAIDPIAAGWQNWNEANRYLPFRTNAGVDHALPQSYRSNNYPKDAANLAYYKAGDNWFRDGKEPGYGATVMPGGFTGNKTALQFLGQQVAADSRFALGAVHFWYEGLFGREPLKAPQDSTAPQFAAQLAAYNAQNEEFRAMATRFAANQGRGAFNVKDLLVDLMLSPLTRAEKAADAGTRAGELQDLGSVTMLSPSQLNRKLTGLVGQGWVEFNNPYTGWALNYGDFDGVSRTTRAQSHTMMQTVTIDRLLSVRSCTFAKGDLDKAAVDRLLFPLVTLADTPASAAGLAAITANVRHLHKWLWKEDLPESDPEVQRTLKLFTDTWAERATAPARPVNCAYNNGNDPNYSGRAWATVLAYMLGDVKFLYE
ncbi:MAG: hypothetical protein HZC37_27945 [Burkholderiales bacterium]|nr:hypothetical protein [Burkholderiales bacterium]